jgi:uncharacterized delta-60 repeat protein
MLSVKNYARILFCALLCLPFIGEAQMQYNNYVLDSSFNQTGQKLTTVQGQAVKCLVLPDSSILMGGYGNVNGKPRFIVLRLNSDGTPYTNWGVGGKVVDSFVQSDQDEIKDMLYLPGGRVLLLGMSDSVTTNPPHTYFKYALSKHLMNGDLDSTFGINGMVKLPDQLNVSGLSMATQTYGQIILTGSQAGDIMVCRLKNDGSVDSSFGTDGVTAVGIGTLPMDVGTSVKVLADDRIVVGGHTYHTAQDWAAVLRFLPNGGVDNSFGTNGHVETNVSSYGDFVNNITIQPNGKILATGYNAHTNGPITILIIRYDSTGVLDGTFGNNGVVVKNINNYDDKSYNAVVQPDGKIVLGGYNTNASINLDFLLCRIDSNGLDDGTFAANGLLRGNFRFNQSNFNDHGQCMCMQPDGKFIVAGYSALSGAGNFAIMRWKPTVIIPPTGINETTNEETTLVVYPNPAIETLTVNIKGTNTQENIVIEDLLGRKMMEAKIPANSKELKMNIAGFSSGVYVLKLQNEQGNVRAIKWIKE